MNCLQSADEIKDTVGQFGICCHIWFALAIASSWSRALDWTKEMEKDYTEALELLRQALADLETYDFSIRADFPGRGESAYGMGHYALEHLYVSRSLRLVVVFT